MTPLQIAFYILMFALSIGYWIGVFVILYHLTRFGVGVQPKRLAAGFLLGAVVLFVLSLVFFMNLDFTLILK